MHPFRTHTCGALRPDQAGETVKLSGWVHRKRDHGGVLFIDLRDHYGLTQCVVNSDSPLLETLERIRVESVITVTGEVLERTDETKNDNLPTGGIELKVNELEIQSEADQVPLQVNSDEDAGDEHRLKYRYLDLRRDRMQRQMILRSDVIDYMRDQMKSHGFREYQTPILTASSPEGARDFLVPARRHPGKFYALPQAPQQFKQLYMISGYDRYFQVAPCFRDEDSRADRSPGDFYQLDFEMSFATQDEVFAVQETVLNAVFEKFSDFTGTKKTVTKTPFPRIKYKDAMLKYGTDKPDLRNPLVIVDVSDVFARDDVEFKAFKSIVTEKGGVVRAIRVPSVGDQPRSFFDKLNDWARAEGAPGLGYILREGDEGKGPIAKFVPGEAFKKLSELTGLESGDAVFFVCDQEEAAAKMAGRARTQIAETLDIIDKTRFDLCWIVDYPMYEMNDEGQLDFSHNPFSMPQGGLDSLLNDDPLDILAYQYDCVCNGYELSSGAIRNHRLDVMEKAFEIAGYPKEKLYEKFGGLSSAFKYGAPPHGGSAPGIDRIVMLLADQHLIREVMAFPLNQQGEDPLMGAPTLPDDQQLKDLHIKVNMPKEVKTA